jgi:hypothetical protein
MTTGQDFANSLFQYMEETYHLNKMGKVECFRAVQKEGSPLLKRGRH